MGEAKKSAQSASETTNKNATAQETIVLQPDIYNYTWQMPKKGVLVRRKRISCAQSEITLNQELEMVRLLSKHHYRKDGQKKAITSLEDLKEALILPDFLDWLVNSGDILKIFRILLQPRLTLEQIGAMPLTIQGRIIQDFFALNPGLAMLLRAFGNGRASTPGNPKGHSASTRPTA